MNSCTRRRRGLKRAAIVSVVVGAGSLPAVVRHQQPPSPASSPWAVNLSGRISGCVERVRPDDPTSSAHPGTSPDVWVTERYHSSNSNDKEYIPSAYRREKAADVPYDPARFPRLHGDRSCARHGGECLQGQRRPIVALLHKHLTHTQGPEEGSQGTSVSPALFSRFLFSCRLADNT